MPEIDIVLGNEEKANIVQYVEKFIENEKKLIEIEDIATKKEFEDYGANYIYRKNKSIYQSSRWMQSDFALIVLFHMQEEELEVEMQKA